MDWQQATEELTKKGLEIWAEEGMGSTQIFQIRLGRALANMGTIEEAILHFESEKDLIAKDPERFAAEVGVLHDIRDNLVLEAAARVLLYYVALKQNREKKDGGETRAGAGDRVREGP